MNKQPQLEMSTPSYTRFAARAQRAIMALAIAAVFVGATDATLSQSTVVRGHQLQLFNADGTQSTSLVPASDLTGSYTITLPSTAPSTGSLLYLTNGSGKTAWTNGATAGQVLVAQGASLTPTWSNLSDLLPGTVWNTSGNSNITATNFLGTTTAQPLVLKTKGNEAMRIDTNGNIGLGTGASTTLGSKFTLGDGNLLLSNSGTRGELHLQEASANGSNYVGIRAGSSMASDYTITMPSTGPTRGGQTLRTGSSTATDLEWSDLNIPRYIRKTATQTQQGLVAIPLAPVMEDDDDLKVDVEANATYVFDAFLKVRKSNIVAAADLALEFTGPANADFSFGYSSSAAAIGNSIVNALGITTGAIGITAIANAYTYIHVQGIIRTGNNDGTLQLRWGTSGLLALGFTISVQENSYMVITRVE